jgi:phosphoglycolate phosphatase
MRVTKTLLVFDIDGTLITTKAGRSAFNRAFERVFGIKDATRSIAMAGCTDTAIFADACNLHGLDPATFGHWKLEFLADLAEAMVKDPGHCLPGVMELVRSCSENPQFALALGTGNVEEGARMKLAPHGLNGYFTTGGFGSDGDTRADVIATGIRRAEGLNGGAFNYVVILGDTPHDILCGQANGCFTVGVATGPFSQQELLGCGADLCLPDFTDPTRLIYFLQNLHK